MHCVMFMCVSVCAYMYVLCMHVCSVCVYINAYMSVCMYACMYISVCV